MRKEFLSAIKLTCHEFGVIKESFSLLKGFFYVRSDLMKKLSKTRQSLFITFTFER